MVLSEIVDYRGTHILPVMIHPAPATQYEQHYRQNTSMLQWPRSHPPGPAAWRTWREFIIWQYLQPNSFRLGCWLQQYQQDYQWRWQICPQTKVLFHHDQQQWWAYMPEQYYETHIRYRNRCSPTSIPHKTVPVTPILFALKIHVTLPVHWIVQQPVTAPDTRALSLRIITPQHHGLKPYGTTFNLMHTPTPSGKRSSSITLSDSSAMCRCTLPDMVPAHGSSAGNRTCGPEKVMYLHQSRICTVD